MRTNKAYTLVGMLILMATAEAQADHHCANLPGMLLRIDTYHIELNDKRPICVIVGGEFNIRINDPSNLVESGKVKVRQKDLSSPPKITIEGANYDPDLLKVAVDGDPEGEEYFDFWIEVEGVGKLDPRIRVIPSSEFDSLLRTYVQDALDSYGLPIEYQEKVLLPNSD